MKAMILAAGLGERMRPLTETRAKPSLPLLNRPLIVQTLTYLKWFGVEEVVINLHYQPESIRGVIGDGRRIGVKVHYSEEQLILGTAGGLKKAEAYLRGSSGSGGSGTFILINGDFFTDCDLGAVIADHKKSGAVSTMVLTPHRPGTNYGNVETDPTGQVIAIAGLRRNLGVDRAGSQVGNNTFTGIHVLEPAIFDIIPPGVKSEINSEIYPALMQSGGSIRGWVHNGLWFEMGTPRLYLEGNLALLSAGQDHGLQPLRQSEGVFLEQITLPASVTAAPPLLVGRGSTMGERCSVQGGVIIGRQCRIGAGCALRSSMIWDGARLGDKVQLTDCIVTSGVFVPPGSSLSGRVLFRVDGYQGRKDHLERVGSAWAARIA
jgi:NDP-sugar pyrophosphorylase family protein